MSLLKMGSVWPKGTLFTNSRIVGLNIATREVVFDSGSIPGNADGTALGTGTLAGNIFATNHRAKLALFFFFVRVQKMFGVIAPPIAWEELPGPASM